jgi:hypothetical protein
MLELHAILKVLIFCRYIAEITTVDLGTAMDDITGFDGRYLLVDLLEMYDCFTDILNC